MECRCRRESVLRTARACRRFRRHRRQHVDDHGGRSLGPATRDLSVAAIEARGDRARAPAALDRRHSQRRQIPFPAAHRFHRVPARPDADPPNVDRRRLRGDSRRAHAPPASMPPPTNSIRWSTRSYGSARTHSECVSTRYRRTTRDRGWRGRSVSRAHRAVHRRFRRRGCLLRDLGISDRRHDRRRHRRRKFLVSAVLRTPSAPLVPCVVRRNGRVRDRRISVVPAGRVSSVRPKPGRNQRVRLELSCSGRKPATSIRRRN